MSENGKVPVKTIYADGLIEFEDGSLYDPAFDQQEACEAEMAARRAAKPPVRRAPRPAFVGFDFSKEPTTLKEQRIKHRLVQQKDAASEKYRAERLARAKEQAEGIRRVQLGLPLTSEQQEIHERTLRALAHYKRTNSWESLTNMEKELLMDSGLLEDGASASGESRQPYDDPLSVLELWNLEDRY